MSRLFQVLLLLAISADLADAQSRITTVTGAVYSGTILTEDSREIKLFTSDSLEIVIPREKVEAVSYGRTPRNVTAADPAVEAHEMSPQAEHRAQAPILRREAEPHWSLGASLGTPAGIQPVLGYHFGEWGVRGSAMVIPDATMGLQVGIMKRITSTGHLDVNAMLISGFSVIENSRYSSGGYSYYIDETWLYAGPALSLDIFGIFLEGGLSLGVGDFSNPQLMVQLGYAYHLR